MSETILVVEYEPRYTERVRQALAGQPFHTTFARDGEEAMRALEGARPQLIILSSVVPKVSTSELIRTIRSRHELVETPILLTVSGYNGKSPQGDAQRVGATDVLPKPYSEMEVLEKVRQLLGLPAARVEPPMTSSEIFGDLLEEEKTVRRPMSSKTSDEVDKMLADTLGGMMPQRRREPSSVPQPSKPKSASGSSELDRMLQDTLSGLEKSARRTTGSGSTRVPAPPQETEAAGVADETMRSEPPATTDAPDRLTMSRPVLVPGTDAPRPDDDNEPVDGTRFGQYVLVEKIAAGGMAEVWKARMRGVEGFQKIVAIKKILPHLSDNQDFIEMFIDEAKLAAQLNHNNIIHIYDLGKIQSSYYIAMEYVDGFDLKTILRRAEERDHPMTVELALFIASKVGAALDYAHRKKDFEEREMGLVHRDVSPQNVLISQEGDIKLCDFGIAKAASKASHTQAGALKGKLQYMSPEQAWGQSIDRRSDVFALATVLFEMLAGRKLFAGDNELSILDQVREARVTAPSLFNDEVTPEIDNIVLKALQKDPASRYQTAGEMTRDIDAILYNFRPTPTSADLAIFMHRLTAAAPVERIEEPASSASGFAVPAPVESSPFAKPSFEIPAPVIRSAPAHPSPVAAAALPSEPVVQEEAPEKKSRFALVAAIVVLLLAGGGGAAWMMTRSAPETQPLTTQAAVVPRVSEPVTAIDGEPGDLNTLAEMEDPAAADTAVDPSLVDREVQKLLAAERARLESQARAQGAAPARAAPPTTAAVQQSEVRAPAPAQPVEEPPAVQQAETQPVAETPAPQAAPQQVAQQPAPATVKEGDMVPVGTAGLVAARVVRRGAVQYPPIARMQKVEGTVITSVLVSETGQVLEVRIVRGVNRPVGLNEAAEQAMRRSTFAPGMKDGVRVKSWITVPVEFKL